MPYIGQSKNERTKRRKIQLEFQLIWSCRSVYSKARIFHSDHWISGNLYGACLIRLYRNAWFSFSCCVISGGRENGERKKEWVSLKWTVLHLSRLFLSLSLCSPLSIQHPRSTQLIKHNAATLFNLPNRNALIRSRARPRRPRAPAPARCQLCIRLPPSNWMPRNR